MLFLAATPYYWRGRAALGHVVVAGHRDHAAVRRGAGEILLTSMDRDGVRGGYDLDLLRAVTNAVKVPVIASGGAGEARHMVEAVTEGGADAVLAASIFHFGEFTIAQAKAHLKAHGVAVRD